MVISTEREGDWGPGQEARGLGGGSSRTVNEKQKGKGQSGRLAKMACWPHKRSGGKQKGSGPKQEADETCLTLEDKIMEGMAVNCPSYSSGPATYKNRVSQDR